MFLLMNPPIPFALPGGLLSHVVPAGGRCRNVPEGIGRADGIEVPNHADLARIPLHHAERPVSEVLGNPYLIESHLGGEVPCDVAKDMRRDTLVGRRWTGLLCHSSILGDQMLNCVGAEPATARTGK